MDKRVEELQKNIKVNNYTKTILQLRIVEKEEEYNKLYASDCVDETVILNLEKELLRLKESKIAILELLCERRRELSRLFKDIISWYGDVDKS